MTAWLTALIDASTIGIGISSIAVAGGVVAIAYLMGWTPPPEAASMCQSGSVEATT